MNTHRWNMENPDDLSGLPPRTIKQHCDAEQGCWVVRGEVESMSKQKYEISITISEDGDGGINTSIDMNPPMKPADNARTTIDSFHRQFVLGIPQLIEIINGGSIASLKANGEELIDD